MSKNSTYSRESKSISSKAKNSRLSWKKFLGVCFLAVFILAIIEELFFLKTLVPFILNSLTVEIVILLLGVIVNILTNYKKVMRLRPKNKSLLEDIPYQIANMWDILKRSTFTFLLVVFFILIYTSSVLAQNRIAGRTAAFFIEGTSAFFNYNQDSLSINSEDSYKNEKIDEKIAASSSVSLPDSNIAPDWFVAHPGSEQSYAKNLKIPDGERDIQLVLQQDEYNKIFFLDGSYEIEDWNDAEEVNRKVQRMVNDLFLVKRENLFDKADGAPESLCEEIVKANSDDKNNWELKQKKDIIIIRNNAFQLYPKYSLAKMISESYNGLGLAYWYQCANGQTSSYYFSQAILWLFECLTFIENTDDINADVLHSISQRYKDISVVSSPESKEYFYSIHLSEAFENVDQFSQ